MSRIAFTLVALGLLAGCQIEGVARPPMVLVCTTPNGVETHRSEQSRDWYMFDGTWRSYDGASYRQSMYESCGTERAKGEK